MSVLRRIIAHKLKEVAAGKKAVPSQVMRRKALSLQKKRHAFEKALKKGRPMAVIAEIKRRSPSKGLLSRNFDVKKIARQYEMAGAAALSVLTDRKFFGGSPSFIGEAKRSANLPVLRKDFIVDEYQVYESRVLGADAILLIAAALDVRRLRAFFKLATKLGLDTLFEVHDEMELKKVRPLRPRLVGVNNRNLSTFHTDLGVSRRLAGKIPKRALFISESGISNAGDLAVLRQCGAQAVLVGESLMRARDPGKALKRLLRGHGSR